MVLLNACVKDKYTGNQAAGQGPSYVRITEAKVYSQFFAPFSTIKPITMFSVRRDAASTTDLAATNAVVLTDITSTYLSTYNTKNGTSYSSMPSTLYTFATTDATIAKTSTGYTFNFGPGDFAKNLVFNIDGSQVDLSKQYGIVFAISNTGGLTRKAGLDTIVATVAIKNKYDGVYVVQLGSTMTDLTSTVYSHINNFLSSFGTAVGEPDNGPMQYQLRTTSANTCALYDDYFFGGYDTPICTGTAATNYSSWGTFSPIFTFDLATDKVTAVTNYYGVPANTRGARLDPSGTVNAWESGKFTIKYDMTQPSIVATPPNVRVVYDEVWKFKGSR